MSNNCCISNKFHTDFLLRLPGWEIAETAGIINDGLVGNGIDSLVGNDTDCIFIVVK